MRPPRRIALALAAGLVPLVLGALLAMQAAASGQQARLAAAALGYAGRAMAEVAGLAVEGGASRPSPALAAASRANDARFGTAALSQAYRELRDEAAAGAHPAAARNAVAMLADRLLQHAEPMGARLASLNAAMNEAPLALALVEASRYTPAATPAPATRLEELLATLRRNTVPDEQGGAYGQAAETFLDLLRQSSLPLEGQPVLREPDADSLSAAHRAFQSAAAARAELLSGQLSEAQEARASEAEGRAAIMAAMGVVTSVLGLGAALLLSGRRAKRMGLEAILTPIVIGEGRTQYHRLVDTPEGFRLPMASKLKFPQLKLRGKIVLAAAAVFTVALGATLTYVVSSTTSHDLASADELLSALARNEATSVELVLKEHAVAAEAMAQTLGALMSQPTAGPDVYKNLFERQITIVPNSVGIWALLNKDAPTAANPMLMSSEYGLPEGYFGPSISRDVKTGAISWGPLDLSMENGFKDWYLDPLAKNAPSLVGPYLYDEMLYTSSTAIVRDGSGKAVGLAGVDYNGGVFAQLIGAHKPLGTGWVGVINAEGNWVVPPDASQIGKPAEDETAKSAIAGAKAGSFHASLPVNGEAWRLAAIELPLAQFGISWTVLVGVPESTLLAEANAQRNMLLIGGLVVLALGLAAFAWLGSSIARPVSRMTAVMRQIADSDFSVAVPNGHRKDEIGDMAKAVEVFRQNGLKVAEMTEAEAARIVRDQEARAQMMAELQKAFGRVVDAAVAGDFSQRVDTEFPDAELNAIATSINNLVGTVDRGLAETGHVLAALADTDLTKRMKGSYEGAFARLKSDTNAVADKLSNIVTQLKETSRTLKTATGEILSGTNDLSERTTRQAATIEETSAAMEQLAVTVLQNAQRAKEASEVAGTVTRTAEEGGQVMSEANAAMERITASSAKISNIIGLIDDIAFQTNLLALNASVEAARAGEAGKGFAVVAVEVRRLAQSAAEASSEVKVLIEQSGAEVKSGSRLVADASARLGAMLEAARSSNTLMDGIARESREQAAAIEEVNTAVRQLDEMTQHNAALVEETNAAIEQTEAQATDLDRVVDIFTVANAQPVAPARAPQTAPEQRGGGIRALQEKVKTAARSYLTQGNAAIDREWAEF